MNEERIDAPPAADVPQPEPELPPASNRFAVAGRIGAERVRRLAELGQQYERDHGLTRGRQRLRQLVQLGRRYEQEHGLAAAKPRKRATRADVWAEFVRALAAVVKPALRGDVERLATDVQSNVNAAA